jgi:hypothetical protein
MFGMCSPEENRDQHDECRFEIERLRTKLATLQVALRRIQKWSGEFPETGQFFDNDPARPVSYGAAHGSDGERDFMRQVAANALLVAEPELAESEELLPRTMHALLYPGDAEDGVPPRIIATSLNEVLLQKKLDELKWDAEISFRNYNQAVDNYRKQCEDWTAGGERGPEPKYNSEAAQKMCEDAWKSDVILTSAELI